MSFILMFSGSGFCSSRQILLIVMLFHVAKDPMLFLFFKSTLLYHFMQLLQITTIQYLRKQKNEIRACFIKIHLPLIS